MSRVTELLACLFVETVIGLLALAALAVAMRVMLFAIGVWP